MFTFLSQNMRKVALDVAYVNYHVLIKLFMLEKRWNKWWKNVLFKEKLGHLADCSPTEQDFENQRKAYRLIVEYLEQKAQYNITEKEE